jgi:hypothetical protein
MTKVPGRSPGGRQHQVIELRLTDPREMFEISSTDLFSEYRNFLTGVDFCLSELRGRASTRPVRLEIRLPPEAIDDGVAERLARTLRRYCDHRIRYNRREGQAQRVGGVAALRVGIPVSALGLVVAAEATRIRPTGSAGNLVTDHLGWVLAWIGLWFPLDQFLFNPLAYRRESRVLHLLAGADIDVRPYRPGADPEAR